MGSHIRRVKIYGVNVEVMDAPSSSCEPRAIYNFINDEVSYDYSIVLFVISLADFDQIEEAMRIVESCFEILGKEGV